MMTNTNKASIKKLLVGAAIGALISTFVIANAGAQNRGGQWGNGTNNPTLRAPQQSRNWNGNQGWNNSVPIHRPGWNGNHGWNNGWNGNRGWNNNWNVNVGIGVAPVWGWNTWGWNTWGWAPPIVYQQTMPVTMFQPNVVVVDRQPLPTSNTLARLAEVDRMILAGTISFNEAQDLRLRILNGQ